MSAREELEAPAAIESLNVVTIGDSLAFGSGDESGGGIAGRLDDLLVEAGVRRVQITNLGVSGAQTVDVTRSLSNSRVRATLAEADAIVLSIGANDLFRTPAAREQLMRSPLMIAGAILNRIGSIVAELHVINPGARILLLGGYNPVPQHPMAPMITEYLGLWDAKLAQTFESDGRVRVIRMSDIVTPERLSGRDSFHPGGAAYQQAAERIAGILVERNVRAGDRRPRPSANHSSK